VEGGLTVAEAVLAVVAREWRLPPFG
jgi:hypothetical protein